MPIFVYRDAVPSSRSRLLLVLAVAAVLVAGAGIWSVTGDGGGRYGHSLERYGDGGEANRYFNLPDGEAQLAYGSPDRHRLVVQWRDPDGHGWTAPDTVYVDKTNTAIDSTIRYAGGTIAIDEAFTPDTSKDNDIGDIAVRIVCRDERCTPGEAFPGYSADEPQLTPDGATVYFGQSKDGVLMWTEDGGFDEWSWSGHPDWNYRTTSSSEPLLSPDGSLRVVSAKTARGSCTFALLSSTPGNADLDELARTTEPLRGVAESDCRSYLDTFSADWVSTHPDDHRADDFWFIRDGDAWTTTKDDPSGLVAFARGRSQCCGLAIAGFIHWNDLAFGSPDGQRISVQTHFQGEESWEPRQLLDGAPDGYRCTWLDGGEVGDGFALLLTCHSGRGGDPYRGDAYAVAYTPDLVHWESAFVTDVTNDPVIDDGVTIKGTPRTTVTPEDGIVQDD